MSTNTDTLLMEFPKQPLWTNVHVRDHAKASVPLLWSRVQVIEELNLVFLFEYTLCLLPFLVDTLCLFPDNYVLLAYILRKHAFMQLFFIRSHAI